MDEPFDTRIMLLSAVQAGLGQVAAGRLVKGLVLIVLGASISTLGGVTGRLVRILTFGRVKALPTRFNGWTVLWAGIWLYNMYDAYTIAAGADEDEDLFDYEEYEPPELDLQDALANLAAGGTGLAAGGSGVTVGDDTPAGPTNPEAPGAATHAGRGAGRPASPQAAGPGESARPARMGLDLANAGNAVAALGQAADQLNTGGAAVGQGTVQANQGPSGPIADQRPNVAGGRATTAGPIAPAEANREFDFSTLGIQWDKGITKTELLDLLGDDERVQGVFGHYLPSGRTFYAPQEVLTLIPVQAWQAAQGKAWTGGDLPGGDVPTGFGDSAAGSTSCSSSRCRTGRRCSTGC